MSRDRMPPGMGGPEVSMVKPEFDYRQHEAYGAIVMVERVTHKSSIVHLESGIPTDISTVISKGALVRGDVEVGDRIVYSTSAALHEQVKGPTGGRIFLVPESSILTVDRSRRRQKTNEDTKTTNEPVTPAEGSAE
jgi:hypothetical protein